MVFDRTKQVFVKMVMNLPVQKKLRDYQLLRITLLLSVFCLVSRK